MRRFPIPCTKNYLYCGGAFTIPNSGWFIWAALTPSIGLPVRAVPTSLLDAEYISQSRLQLPRQ